MKKLFLLCSFLMFAFTAQAIDYNGQPDNVVICDIGDYEPSADVKVELYSINNIEKSQKTIIEKSRIAKLKKRTTKYFDKLDARFEKFLDNLAQEKSFIVKNTEKPPSLYNRRVTESFTDNIHSSSGGLPRSCKN